MVHHMLTSSYAMLSHRLFLCNTQFYFFCSASFIWWLYS